MFAYGLIWSGARVSSRIVAIGFLMFAFSRTFAAGQPQSYDGLMDSGYKQLQQGEVERLDGESEREAEHNLQLRFER